MQAIPTEAFAANARSNSSGPSERRFRVQVAPESSEDNAVPLDDRRDGMPLSSRATQLPSRGGSAVTTTTGTTEPEIGFDDDDDAELDKPTTLRGKIYRFLEVPSSSRWATAVAMFMIAIILMSTIVFLIGSLPEYWDSNPVSLFILESISIAFFTIEYLIKLATAPSWWRFMLYPFSIIDLIAIVPYYIELGLASSVSALAVVRVLRLLRIFRVVKLGRHSRTFKVVAEAFKRSKDGIALFGFIILLLLVTLSTCMFFAEQTGATFDSATQQWINDDGTVSWFQSIPATFWWCIITITTVGYGDTFPKTPAGKAVAAVAAIGGVLALAFPITILLSNFSETMNEYKDREKELIRKHQAKKRLRQEGVLTRDSVSLTKILAELQLKDSETKAELAKQEDLVDKISSQIKWLRLRQDQISDAVIKLKAYMDLQSDGNGDV